MTVSSRERNGNRGVCSRVKKGDGLMEFWVRSETFKYVSQAVLGSEPHLEISCTAPSRSGPLFRGVREYGLQSVNTDFTEGV